MVCRKKQEQTLSKLCFRKGFVYDGPTSRGLPFAPRSAWKNAFEYEREIFGSPT